MINDKSSGYFIHPLSCFKCTCFNDNPEPASFSASSGLFEPDVRIYRPLPKNIKSVVLAPGPINYIIFNATRDSSTFFNINGQNIEEVLSPKTHNLAFCCPLEGINFTACFEIELKYFIEEEMQSVSVEKSVKFSLLLDVGLHAPCGMLEFNLKELFKDDYPQCYIVKITRKTENASDILPGNCYLLNPVLSY